MTTKDKQTTATAYEPVMGVETHVQLSTDSKMFCSCSARYRDSEPNTQVCAVCAGLPGALPTVNRRAVKYAMMIAMALGCSINADTRFDRKNYSYPDLVKGYQISQADLPIGYAGKIHIASEEGEQQGFAVRINRVHMEEDVAKLTHKDGYDLMDLNRSGVPLMEVVTEPDFRSPEQVTAYVEELQRIIRFLGVGTANMEDGSFRCDANVSIRPAGVEELGVKIEIKNMNRIDAIGRALKYEIQRLTDLVSRGEPVVQSTRGWNDEKGVTFEQRLKEESSDYRYFPEPDIPPLRITSKFQQEVKDDMPTLPTELRKRLTEKYELSSYDAKLLISDPSTYRYFSEALEAADFLPAETKDVAKSLANWINSELAGIKNAQNKNDIYDLKLPPSDLVTIADKFRRREINNQVAKKVLEEAIKTGKSPAEIIEEQGLRSISSPEELKALSEKVVNANPKAVNDYLGGKETALQALVGGIMKETKGQADPQMALEAIKKALE